MQYIHNVYTIYNIYVYIIYNNCMPYYYGHSSTTNASEVC